MDSSKVERDDREIKRIKIVVITTNKSGEELRRNIMDVNSGNVLEVCDHVRLGLEEKLTEAGYASCDTSCGRWFSEGLIKDGGGFICPECYGNEMDVYIDLNS